MNIKLDDNIPIYLQIMSIFRRMTASGDLKPGERIAPVRELAKDFGVNPNTMQRALSELEKEGLLFSERTNGRFVTKNIALLNELRSHEAMDAAETYWQQMKSLGFSKEEALDFFIKSAAERGQGKRHA